MTKKSSFTDKERAAWHDNRRHVIQGDVDTEVYSMGGNTCIHCGTPLTQNIPDGYEAALCDACD